MLVPQTDINLLQRYDETAEAWIYASGKTGTFVEIKNGTLAKPTAGNKAFPIWSESNRDLSAGFTPDTVSTGKLSVLVGTIRATTDQYTGTPTVGAKLYVDADGKLTVTSAGNAIAVAICTKAPFEYTYLSKKFNAIEYITL